MLTWVSVSAAWDAWKTHYEQLQLRSPQFSIRFSHQCLPAELSWFLNKLRQIGLPAANWISASIGLRAASTFNCITHSFTLLAYTSLHFTSLHPTSLLCQQLGSSKVRFNKWATFNGQLKGHTNRGQQQFCGLVWHTMVWCCVGLCCGRGRRGLQREVTGNVNKMHSSTDSAKVFGPKGN